MFFYHMPGEDQDSLAELRGLLLGRQLGGTRGKLE